MSAKNRFLLLIVGLYALPVIALSLYASSMFSSSRSFGVFTTGILLSIFGSVFFFLFEKENRFSAPPLVKEEPALVNLSNDAIDPKEYEERLALLEECQKQISLHLKQEGKHLAQIAELQKEKDLLEKKIESLNNEHRYFQEMAKEQQENNAMLLHEHQLTINEQRETLEKKHSQIAQLEGQVRDLHYEIKTLLEVDERPSIIRFPGDRYRANKEFDYSSTLAEEEETFVSPPQVHCPEEASQQLKRCLDIAQKITGGHFSRGAPSRLRGLPVENTALEMRRLFDNLRSEKQATILLYSPKENKLLFANNPIRSLVGWTPEKFIQQFSDLLVDGGESWKQSVGQLAFKNETQGAFGVAAKSGERVFLNCHMGLIPTGSFRHYVLAVVYR